MKKILIKLFYCTITLLLVIYFILYSLFSTSIGLNIIRKTFNYYYQNKHIYISYPIKYYNNDIHIPKITIKKNNILIIINDISIRLYQPHNTINKILFYNLLNTYQYKKNNVNNIPCIININKIYIYIYQKNIININDLNINNILIKKHHHYNDINVLTFKIQYKKNILIQKTIKIKLSHIKKNI